MPHIALIAHNLRSAHNVGSLLRTAEGLGVHKVYLTGYTPYPLAVKDERLPHLAQKIDKQIHKTALGAEELIDWIHLEDVHAVIAELSANGFIVCGLEQAARSVPLQSYETPEKVALILGREVEGLESEIQDLCDTILEIPMFGKKESFNVVQAAAMALYHFVFGAN